MNERDIKLPEADLQNISSLDDARKLIDQANDALLTALSYRFAVTRRVGEIKSERGLPPLNSDREKEVLGDFGDKAAEEGLNYDFAITIMQMIMDQVKIEHENIANGHHSSSPQSAISS